MKLSDLQTMFMYLRRAFTTKESRELLSEFFPSFKTEIKELTMTEIQNVEPTEGAKRVTNMDRARVIFGKAEDQTRKAIIKLFMEQIGMSQATASTYFYQVAPKVERVSNVEKARVIYAAAEAKTRKALVPVFMSDLGMSENVASTYFYNCKKYFAELAQAQAAASVEPTCYAE